MKKLIIIIVGILILLVGIRIGLEIEPRFDYVADRKYDYHNYNCLNFSEDLVKELAKKGVQSEVIKGRNKSNKPHAWVGVWVEPITGEFTNGYKKGL